MEIGLATTMREILEAYPAAKVGLFQRYHVGGCQSCGYEPGETLGSVLRRNNIQDPIEKVVETIRSAHEVESKLHIGVRELKSRLGRGESPRILDLRTPEEFAAGRLPGAVLLTPEVSFEALEAWPKEDLVVVYDAEGKTSLDRASWFRAYGLKNARSLDGGFRTWKGIEAEAAEAKKKKPLLGLQH
ncbi:MAG: rhodanese-like domain-containing protein [Planctomycetales bacterium]|nr:rhodanese-like domain-containing protein [Planctomycetales bacterium]